MEERDETKGSAYPRGRGYGHDYMRGGEVFGGYGYSARNDYERPRGSEGNDENDREGGETDDADSAVEHAAPVNAALGRSDAEPVLDRANEGDDALPAPPAPDRQADGDGESVERFPQDERAGGWELPHDLDGERRLAEPVREPGPESGADGEIAGESARLEADRREPPVSAGTSAGASGGDGAGDGAAPAASAPVPQIEHTFGDTGGTRAHSRSYYVTQAQLQQRLYALPEERGVDDGNAREISTGG